jgi:DNA mismatch endonuclease (patch repair protein)
MASSVFAKVYPPKATRASARQAGWRRGCSLSLGSGSGIKDLASGVQSPEPGSKIRDPKTKLLRRIRSTGRVRPDFIFPRLRVAVFVDGCFWHGCPRHATWPKSRAAFWRKKITGNMARDRRVNYALRKRGWTALRVWEHELIRKNELRLLRRLRKVLAT